MVYRNMDWRSDPLLEAVKIGSRLFMLCKPGLKQAVIQRPFISEVGSQIHCNAYTVHKLMLSFAIGNRILFLEEVAMGWQKRHWIVGIYQNCKLNQWRSCIATRNQLSIFKWLLITADTFCIGSIILNICRMLRCKNLFHVE